MYSKVTKAILSECYMTDNIFLMVFSPCNYDKNHNKNPKTKQNHPLLCWLQIEKTGIHTLRTTLKRHHQC